MDSATLDEGAALLAAVGTTVYNEANYAKWRKAKDELNDWLACNAADLIASARQAQDNTKDAERYRWLKDGNATISFANEQSWLLAGNRRIYAKEPATSELDDAIDAAIAAATPGKEQT